MGIGAGELGEDEGVEAIGLAVRHRIARAGGFHLVGMDRPHLQVGAEQPLDQDALGPLDRHPANPVGSELANQLLDASLLMRHRKARHNPPLLADAHLVGLAGPVDPSGPDSCHASSSVESIRLNAGREVPLRFLIGWRSSSPRPVGASGASHRREALISYGPSRRLGTLALSRRGSALCASRDSAAASLRSASPSESQEDRGEDLQ